jgi:hypothetical protein
VSFTINSKPIVKILENGIDSHVLTDQKMSTISNSMLPADKGMINGSPIFAYLVFGLG